MRANRRNRPATPNRCAWTTWTSSSTEPRDGLRTAGIGFGENPAGLGRAPKLRELRMLKEIPEGRAAWPGAFQDVERYLLPAEPEGRQHSQLGLIGRRRVGRAEPVKRPSQPGRGGGRVTGRQLRH